MKRSIWNSKQRDLLVQYLPQFKAADEDDRIILLEVRVIPKFLAQFPVGKDEDDAEDVILNKEDLLNAERRLKQKIWSWFIRKAPATNISLTPRRNPRARGDPAEREVMRSYVEPYRAATERARKIMVATRAMPDYVRHFSRYGDVKKLAEDEKHRIRKHVRDWLTIEAYHRDQMEQDPESGLHLTPVVASDSESEASSQGTPSPPDRRKRRISTAPDDAGPSNTKRHKPLSKTNSKTGTNTSTDANTSARGRARSSPWFTPPPIRHRPARLPRTPSFHHPLARPPTPPRRRELSHHSPSPSPPPSLLVSRGRPLESDSEDEGGDIDVEEEAEFTPEPNPKTKHSAEIPKVEPGTHGARRFARRPKKKIVVDDDEEETLKEKEVIEIPDTEEEGDHLADDNSDREDELEQERPGSPTTPRPIVLITPTKDKHPPSTSRASSTAVGIPPTPASNTKKGKSVEDDVEQPNGLSITQGSEFPDAIAVAAEPRQPTPGPIEGPPAQTPIPVGTTSQSTSTRPRSRPANELPASSSPFEYKNIPHRIHDLAIETKAYHTATTSRIDELSAKVDNLSSAMNERLRVLQATVSLLLGAQQSGFAQVNGDAASPSSVVPNTEGLVEALVGRVRKLNGTQLTTFYLAKLRRQPMEEAVWQILDSALLGPPRDVLGLLQTFHAQAEHEGHDLSKIGGGLMYLRVATEAGWGKDGKVHPPTRS